MLDVLKDYVREGDGCLEIRSVRVLIRGKCWLGKVLIRESGDGVKDDSYRIYEYLYLMYFYI